ncbi:MAG: hypothetical protein OSB21_13595 [Myxococcota bacterium]|nr:hypothetical protein [Myxococcota bacterium]
MRQKPDHLTFAAALGSDRCFFRLNEGRFTGKLSGYGELELEQVAPLLFHSKKPLDGAGEFQWRLSWQFNDNLWLWEFRCGLAGTRSKGGELRWDLWPKP